ncbi:MAG TPA: PH domain-containing protein [Thermoplasmata archaeon]|nr:PH domain-containing protein [Thermoplasmata archaeon]
MKPPREPRSPQRSTARTESDGVYHDRGRFSYTVIGVYLFLILLSYLLIPHTSSTLWALLLVVLLFTFFLARYLSTTYSMNDAYLKAWRLAGSRRIRLDSVNRIEFGSMRELSATGFIGSWGWRGRMWSPFIGAFDAVYTDPAKGLLVSGDGVPLYISPNDLDGFARELSRRVRSYTGRLSVDVGDPMGIPSES